ncbi:MAG: hypothetical protein EOO90_16960 [Pedobacter sp.]|nr:MAG: hypothetical protein EOO90_16960 [Pedobacter sp.]
MGRVLIIIYIFIILIALGTVVYFLGGISRQTTPIRRYEYQGSVKELVLDISRYTKLRPNVKYFITDTIGDIKEDYAIRVSLELIANNDDTLEFDLKIEPKDKLVSTRTNVYLTKAYNKTNISGGYQAKSEGVKTLVDFFNSDFVHNIRKLGAVE